MDGACSSYGEIIKMRTKFWLGNVRGKNYSGDQRVDGRLLLLLGGCRLDSAGSGQGPVACRCEHDFLVESRESWATDSGKGNATYQMSTRWSTLIM
jgi:hypothetical protein